MKQRIASGLSPVGLAIGLMLGATGAARAADWDEGRTYSYSAPVYDDVPAPLYAPVVRERVYEYAPAVQQRRVYRYAPVPARERRVYNYAAPPPAPRVVPRGPVYGYGPVAEPLDIVIERENRPLGVYAPETSENLSESRRYFRAVSRQSGGS